MIDETTGLPKLPDGYWWVIGPHEIKIKTWGSWSRWSTFLDMPSFWEQSEREEREVTHVERRWWWFDRTVPVTEYRTRMAFGVVSERYGEYDKTIGFRNRGGFRVDERMVKPDPVTAENLVERATALLAKWDAVEASTNIYGEYPPKKFTPDQEVAR